MVGTIFTRWQIRHVHGRGPSDGHAACGTFGAAMTDTAQALHDITPAPPPGARQEVHFDGRRLRHEICVTYGHNARGLRLNACSPPKRPRARGWMPMIAT
jgi:hypothetical protein